jgi:hypothetical protein
MASLSIRAHFLQPHELLEYAMHDDPIAAHPLPAALRQVRVGIDDESRIRRLAHLAASKIEDLELQVSQLAEELARIGAATDPGWSPASSPPAGSAAP